MNLTLGSGEVRALRAAALVEIGDLSSRLERAEARLRAFECERESAQPDPTLTRFVALAEQIGAGLTAEGATP